MFGILQRLRRYAHNDDPNAAIASTIALVVVGNQPFYPLYLHAIAGSSAWPAWLTLLSTPFFLAIPAVARRNGAIGRAMLVVVGIGNTLLAIKALGREGGLELFLIPCGLLAALLFRPCERMIALPLIALPFLAYFVIDSRLGTPLHVFSADQNAAMLVVNATSVGCLVIIIGLMQARAAADQPRR